MKDYQCRIFKEAGTEGSPWRIVFTTLNFQNPSKTRQDGKNFEEKKFSVEDLK